MAVCAWGEFVPPENFEQFCDPVEMLRLIHKLKKHIIDRSSNK